MSLDKKGAPITHDKQPLQFVIEGKTFETTLEFKTGLELKQLASIPTDTELYLSIDRPYEDELIENDKKINLARPAVEYFFVKKKLKLKIGETVYDWYKQYISRAELVSLGKLNPESEIYLSVKKPWEDELITESTIVDLARPGIEHFYVSDSDNGKMVTILINGNPKVIKRGRYSVSEIKTLGGIPSTHELEELIEGKLTPLDDNASVLIKGNEQFFSHVRDGASS